MTKCEAFWFEHLKNSPDGEKNLWPHCSQECFSESSGSSSLTTCRCSRGSLWKTGKTDFKKKTRKEPRFSGAPVDGSRAEVSEQLSPLAFPESSSHPKVTFPKNLLITSNSSNITSVTAYLTVPQHRQVRDCADSTPGLIGGGSRSGEWSIHGAGGVLQETRSQPFPSVFAALTSVSLNPVVSVSILLFCDDEQLQIRGPIQISLPLKPGLRLRAADTVPAWAFNFNVGKNTDAAEASATLLTRTAVLLERNRSCLLTGNHLLARSLTDTDALFTHLGHSLNVKLLSSGSAGTV